MNVPWQITLFGTLRVERGEQSISRFATAKTAALLARLAYFAPRDHPREELIDLLWPDADPERGRRSLRVALASLRRQLEPPGIPFAEVLRAGHDKIGLTAGSVVSDIGAWEAALRGAAQAESPDAQAARLSQAADLYTGPLLPGFYDDWILAERDRLAQRHLDCLRRLSAAWRELGDWERAIDGAQRALAAEPSHEEVHADLIRLYIAAGQPDSARRQYQTLERVLRDEWQGSPSASLHDLISGGPPSPSLAASAAVVRVPPIKDTVPPESLAADPRIRLPLALTRFFGRELEIATLMQMLTDPAIRLVTLLGPGGAGKTRLALETARHLAARGCFPGPICFVPLADLTDPDRLLAAVAEALRLTLKGDSLPAEQIAAALGTAPSLLVLDNVEHLGEAGAAQVRTLLDSAPSVTCLVTSRRRLDLEGERELLLLPLPTPGLPGLPARLIEFPSVQLFVDRAQAVRPDFQVTRGNADAVAAVCCDLEGLPLALELAAARIQALTPGQMQAQLRARLDFLTSRRRDLPPRHRSLRATLEWSAQLLSPAETHCFRQLSIFRGGWTLEAAEAVCGTAGTLDLLERLREQSLIVAEERAEGMRFRMLESVRAFAAELLTPDDASGLARRHASYFRDFAETAALALVSPDQASWLERLEADHDNLRLALTHWLRDESNNVEEALRLTGALWRFWAVRGHYQEGRAWLAQALARSGGTPDVRAKAANGAGNLAWGQGDYAAAKTLLTEALEINRAEGNAIGVASVLGNLGMVASHQGDFALAQNLHGQCLALRRERGDQRGTAFALDCLAVSLLHQERYAEARPLLAESLALWRSLDHDGGRMMSLCNLAVVLMEDGAYADAAQHFAESLHLARALQDQNALTATVEGFAVLAARQEQFARCVPLLAAMAALRRRLGTPLPPSEVAAYEKTQAAAQAALGEARYTVLWAEGQAMTTPEAIAYALDSPAL